MRSVKIIKSLLIAFVLPVLASAATHRYIIELSTEPAVSFAARSFGEKKESLQRPEVKTHRTRIRTEQDSVAAKVRALGGTIVTRTDTASNTLTVDLPEEKAASLASITGVRGYHTPRTYRPTLDQASIVHKLPPVYGYIGGSDQAGLGVKIAIIDTGIDITQPAYNDSGFQAPTGFPKVNATADTKYTNNKVIVARSYSSLWANPDIDNSASDESGHGTLTSSCAAARSTVADVATFFGQANLAPPTYTGVAPGAFLGSYKVFGTPGYNDGASEPAILAAIDDAVNDGMDVINYSLGSFPPVPAALDSISAALNKAVTGGIIVTASAGNDGNGDDPGNPIDWISSDGYATTVPALVSSEGAMNVIQVGASSNSRAFGSVLTVGSSQFLIDPEYAITSDIHGNYLTFSGAPIIDVFTLDTTGQACSALPANSLKGAIALISLNGYDLNDDTCDPDQKLDNALAAGAVAGIIYDDFPESFYDIYNVYNGFYGVQLLNATNLPGGFITYEDGVALKSQLANQASSTASLDFNINAVPINSNRVAFLSSRGPNSDYEIKPDLVAIGQDLLMTTETVNSGGDFYDPTGVLYGANGTSASSPLVAGAAAVLKAARPGLTALQYRSLLINNAAPIGDPINGGTARVMDSGSGNLDVNAALQAEAAVVPASVNFGVADGTSDLTKTITITNIGGASKTFNLSVVGRDPGFVPSLSTSSLQLDPGASGDVKVTIPGGSVSSGEYEGAIHIQGSNVGVDTHVMYWLGVPSSTPYMITDFGFDLVSYFNRGALNTAAIAFRITDASGIAMTNVLSQVQVTYMGSYNQTSGAKVTGNAKVGAPYYLTDINSPSYSPGVIAADVTTSTARNVYDLFNVTVGDPANPTVSLEFAIYGQ